MKKLFLAITVIGLMSCNNSNTSTDAEQQEVDKKIEQSLNQDSIDAAKRELEDAAAESEENHDGHSHDGHNHDGHSH